MNAYERQQREYLASQGVTVTASRRGKGSHRFLYCLGPNGRLFTLILMMRAGDPRSWKNFQRDVKKYLTPL